MITHMKGLKLTFKHLFILILLAILFSLPQFGSYYILYMVMQILLLSLLSLGANILLGYTGLLSFGQAGIYAAGAYACAKILLAWPSLLLGIIGGLLFVAVLVVILGSLCVKQGGIYFAMLTFSFGMMIYWIAMKWREVTGGDDGLIGIPRAPIEIGPLRINMEPMGNYYYFVLVVSLIAIYILYRIVNSPFGLALRSIRESEVRASFIGVATKNYRLLSFVIAGLYAGLAGTLLAPLERTVTPMYAHWTTSGTPILACLLGGINSFYGPIVGSFLFFIIKDIVMRYTTYWLVTLGIIIVLLVLLFPGGVVEAIEKYFRRRI